jgi:hypothetical protein
MGLLVWHLLFFLFRCKILCVEFQSALLVQVEDASLLAQRTPTGSLTHFAHSSSEAMSSSVRSRSVRSRTVSKGMYSGI